MTTAVVTRVSDKGFLFAQVNGKSCFVHIKAFRDQRDFEAARPGDEIQIDGVRDTERVLRADVAVLQAM